jgi:hypothetical protein
MLGGVPAGLLPVRAHALALVSIGNHAHLADPNAFTAFLAPTRIASLG